MPTPRNLGRGPPAFCLRRIGGASLLHGGIATLIAASVVLLLAPAAEAKRCKDPGRHVPIGNLRAYHTTCDRAESVARKWLDRVGSNRCPTAANCDFWNAMCFAPHPYGSFRVKCEATDSRARSDFWVLDP